MIGRSTLRGRVGLAAGPMTALCLMLLGAPAQARGYTILGADEPNLEEARVSVAKSTRARPRYRPRSKVKWKPRPARTRKAPASRPVLKRTPRPLVIRPTSPGDYLCPKFGAPHARCVTSSHGKSAPVRLMGPGAETSVLGSAELRPPSVPAVAPNQQPSISLLLRSDPRIGFVAQPAWGRSYPYVTPYMLVPPVPIFSPR